MLHYLPKLAADGTSEQGVDPNSPIPEDEDPYFQEIRSRMQEEAKNNGDISPGLTPELSLNSHQAHIRDVPFPYTHIAPNGRAEIEVAEKVSSS